MALTLYIGNKNYSSWSLRPWLALKHAGAAFDEVVIALDRPDTRERIAAVSPSGRVPALRDGDLFVWDSLAICEYVAERFPEAHLWPADHAARAVARSVAGEMHSGFAALRSGMTMNIRRPPSPVLVTDEIRADIERVTTMWRETRARFGRGGPFLFGAYTIADAMYAPVVTRFRSYAVSLEGEAAAYADAVWNDPAMQEWIAASRVEPQTIPKYETPAK
jgi:glutathione S-transferase